MNRHLMPFGRTRVINHLSILAILLALFVTGSILTAPTYLVLADNDSAMSNVVSDTMLAGVECESDHG